MTATTAPAPSRPTITPAPLTLDDRLALAALAVDARTDTCPLDLADVIRLPVEEPRPPAASPYTTPIADLLQRAHDRLQRDGWTTGQQRDTRGALCTVGAIRAEDRQGQADRACAHLLHTIQQQLPHVPTVPAWNDQQTSADTVLRTLAQAARTAAANHL